MPFKKKDFTALLVIICFGLFFFCFVLVPHVLASDLSTDPADGSGSSPPATMEEQGENGEGSESVSAPSESDSSEPDVILVDTVEPDPQPSTVNPSQDVVVDREDLNHVIDLLNDLSSQLALYAANIPAGYEPTEMDLEYRDSLLLTLSDISISLQALTVPPEDEAQEENPAPASRNVDASAPAESEEMTVQSSADSSAPADESTPTDTDPADNPETASDASGESSVIEYNGPRNQDHHFQKHRERGMIQQMQRRDETCHEAHTQQPSRQRLSWRFSVRRRSWAKSLPSTT